MKYEYSIHGPFEIKRREGFKGKKAGVKEDKEVKKSFWEMVEKRKSGLTTACGCYLFAIRVGKGFTPCYVGLAEKGFQKECFAVHKIKIYNEVLSDYGTGTPHLFLIAKLTKKNNKFVKPSKNGRKDIKFLENMLIGTAIVKNPDLKNKMKTKYLREMRVPGLIHTPKKRLTNDEKQFKGTIKKLKSKIKSSSKKG